MSVVLALDLSLTSTGYAVSGDGHITRTGTLTSSGHKGDSLVTRWERLNALGAGVMGLYAGHAPDLVVVEAPSFGSKTGAQHDRSGLWWLIVNRLLAEGPVAQVPPSSRAKYATGKGNASKDAVLTAVVRRYQHLVEADIDSNDVADAIALAAMGSRHLGEAVEPSLPATHLDAMAGAEWPPA